MVPFIEGGALQHCHNSAANRSIPYGARERAVLSRREFERAKAEIASWPGYAPTPIYNLSGLARETGLANIWYKDEGPRFGLGSFKALGGAYAVLRVLAERIEQETGAEGVAARALLSGAYREITSRVTVTCATDGNHGRSVAWGARQFGCNCVIFIHAGVSDGRKRAIESFGARVVRTEGTYDDSVRHADEVARSQGWIVISDTSYAGYMDIPRHVMQGYSVMAEEAIEQVGPAEPPSHIFIPGGVGGFAAAIAAHYWETYGARRPRIVVVEPERAACIYATARAGRPTRAEGDLETIMAGLSCGEISLLAWQILEHGMDDVLTVPDEMAIACMRLLSTGTGGDPPIVAGESAVAGLAGLLAALARPEMTAALGLDARARVLLFGSEGATDPALYRQIVGYSPERVTME